MAKRRDLSIGFIHLAEFRHSSLTGRVRFALCFTQGCPHNSQGKRKNQTCCFCYANTIFDMNWWGRDLWDGLCCIPAWLVVLREAFWCWCPECIRCSCSITCLWALSGARWMKGRGDFSVTQGDAEHFATEGTPTLGTTILSRLCQNSIRTVPLVGSTWKASGVVNSEPCSPTDCVWPWGISSHWICVYWPFSTSMGSFCLPALPAMSCL